MNPFQIILLIICGVGSYLLPTFTESHHWLGLFLISFSSTLYGMITDWRAE
jgi:hypothetical protein